MTIPPFPHVNHGTFIVTPNPPTMRFSREDFWVYEGGMSETDARGRVIGVPGLALAVANAYIVEWKHVPVHVQAEIIAAYRKQAGGSEEAARTLMEMNPVAFRKADVVMMRVQGDS